MANRLVAFVGPIGAGKTEAAMTLVEEGTWACISFAAPLKTLVAKITPDGKIDKLRDRPLLQFVGEQYYRAMNDSHWLDKFAATAHDAFEGGYNVVVDDARYENEIEYIARHYGEIYYIKNPFAVTRAEARDGGAENSLPDHGSNRLISPEDPRVTRVLNNKGTLRQFHALVRDLAEYTELGAK